MSLVKPIYIFSLPRAGSTLLQRILASHDAIATVAEPWILLPLLYSVKPEGIYTEYGHWLSRTAVREFISELPHGEEDYLSELRRFVLHLYSKASGGETTYFVDKTPRYHLVLEEIFRLFPDGKFIFCWRNPLAIAASVIETWGKGKWNLHRAKIDLYKGLGNLIDAYEKHADKALAICYENLLLSPEPECRRVFEYLDLPFDPSVLSRFAQVRFSGRMGDQRGLELYQAISAEPLDKWKGTFANPVRKAWARRYLEWIGKERLKTMGYEEKELLAELKSIPVRGTFIGSDLLRLVWGAGYCVLEPRLLRDKFRRPFDWNSTVVHD